MPFNNLPKCQNEPQGVIKDDGTFVIQTADLGGAIVIFETSVYEREVHRQLGNTNIRSWSTFELK